MISPVFRFWRAGYLLVGCLATASSVQAQIVPDHTLPVNSRVTPGCVVCMIDGGTERGVNLFHSFSEFSVPTGGEAYFHNALPIQNIFSRVTGNSVSNIDGLLRTNGTASLFFLNPNGVIFGQNARLEIGGSFFVSTASSLKFPDGSEFSAIHPQAPPLLTVNVTPGVQWGANQPQTTITNRGNLAAGQDLTLAAGNLDLQGQLVAGRDLTLQAQDTVKVRDSSTSPFIASSDGRLLVQGNQAVDIFALNHPNSGLFSGGNMVLRSANTVGGDAHYWSGGSFRIEKLDGSLGDLYSSYDPIIRSLGDVNFGAYQGTSLHILAGGEVNIGTVIITGVETGTAGVDYLQETVPLFNGREVSINGRLQPTLDIRAGVTPSLIGIPGLTGYNFSTDGFYGWAFLTDAPTSANITIGDVWIVPPNGLVFITNQYQPNTALSGGDITVNGAGLYGDGIDTRGFGGNGGSVILDSRRNIAIPNSGINSSSNGANAGNITLLANEMVSLTNSSIYSTIFGVGKGGDINIQTGQLLVTDSAVGANTRGEGKGGSLIVNASQAVQIIDTTANDQFSSGLFALASGKGDGGNVLITTPWLLVQDGAQVNVKTTGEGNAGSLIVHASDTVQLIGSSTDGQFSSGLFAQTQGKGNGGNVEITTPLLLVQDGARVSVNTDGEGKGGSLIVHASGAVQLMGTSANGQFSSGLLAQTFGTEAGGNVEISTPQLLVKDGARVNVSTHGEGKGGNLIVNASQAVQLIGTSVDGQYKSGLFAQTNGTGDGGSVEITTPWLLVADGAGVGVSTDGEGKGGSLLVNAAQAVQILGTSADGQFRSDLNAQTYGKGDGGNVEITTPWLLVTDGAAVNLSTEGEGKGGSLLVNAAQAVQLISTSADGQFASGLFAQALGKGDGGYVEINTTQLLVKDGARVSATAFEQGKGGSLFVNASQEVQLMGTSADAQFLSSLAAETGGKGDGGNVQISTPRLLVTDGARVSVNTRGEGKGGNLFVNASQEVQLMGISADGQVRSGLFAGTSGTGDGGNVVITTPQLLVTDGARVNVTTIDGGKGGNLFVNASQAVQLMGTTADGEVRSGLAAQTYGIGDGGNVVITTPQLLVTDGAFVAVSTYSEGNAGNLIINTSQAVQLIGRSANDRFPSLLTAQTYGIGDGGNVEITAPWLLVTDGARVNVSTTGEGKGGSLSINASKLVQLTGTSADGQFSSGLVAGTIGKGDGGNVEITTPQLLVTNGAEVSASTAGEGKGGNLIIHASETVQLIGRSADDQSSTGLFAATWGTGEGGNVQVTTSWLLLKDGAVVSVGTTGEGKGGNLIIHASDAVQLMGTSADGQFSSGLVAETIGRGDGGNVQVTTPWLLVQDGAVVTARTRGEGKGGNLIVNASEKIQLNGAGGLFVDAIAGGTAGDLTIKTNEMSVTDGAQVTVSSPQGQAGNLSITANSLTLNRGTISAETAKSNATEGGANITLSGLEFLRMDNESLISASALGNANGGNVTIDSTFIVATPPTGPEGSDIIANAEQGNGGRVNVTTQGLFGIQFRPQRTPENDITVSSTFGLSGEYILNTPGVDPSRGLAQLPTNVVDASQQIDRRCTPQATNRGSSFVVTGRGGIPPSPNEPIPGESVITPNWVILDSEKESTTPPAPTAPTNSAPKQLVEANGWRINEQGQVVLTAFAPNMTPHDTWQPPVQCPTEAKPGQNLNSY